MEIWEEGEEWSAIGLYWMSLERFLQASITRFMNLVLVNFSFAQCFNPALSPVVQMTHLHIFRKFSGMFFKQRVTLHQGGQKLDGFTSIYRSSSISLWKVLFSEMSTLVTSCKFSAGWCFCKMKSKNNSWIFHNLSLHWSEMVIWAPNCRDLAKRVGHSEDKNSKKCFWRIFSLLVLVCRQVA